MESRLERARKAAGDAVVAGSASDFLLAPGSGSGSGSGSGRGSGPGSGLGPGSGPDSGHTAGDGGTGVVWPAGAGHPVLRRGDRVHLVGAGGAGMSGLARVMLERGLRVSGTDRSAGPDLDELGALGARVSVGHAAEYVPADAVLVVPSPAIPPDNPELEAALAAGIPIVKRAALIGTLTREPGTRSICVAGTHGKTTTTAWIVSTLLCAGLDPTFFVGGAIRGLGVNARSGVDPYLIIEADEYDRTFLELSPSVAVITTIEHDHVDLFAGVDDVVQAFCDFARRIVPDGRLIACADVPAIAALAAVSPARLETYGIAGGPPHHRAAAESADWQAHSLHATPEGQSFGLMRHGEELGRFAIALSGLHAVENALAVIAVADAIGLPHEAVRDALPRFRGAGRRFELVGTPAGVRVVDDYAHHPTEVAATIASARQRWPEARLFAVLQPHTFSRAAAMGPDFGRALAAADRAIVTPVYAAREQPIEGVSAASIADHAPNATAVESLDAAAVAVAGEATAGDVALFMGAGDVRRASRRCVELLGRRAVETLVAAGRAAGFGGELRRSRPLSEITSLKVGGPAELVITVKTIADLSGWARLAWEHGVPCRVVGRGSNLLASDAGFAGLVILNRCEGFTVEPAVPGEGDAGAGTGAGAGAAADRAVVTAEGGVSLVSLAQQLARSGWQGLEAAVGIPGSVGASVATNAGAHGWSMSDSVIWAEVLDRSGIRRLDNASLGFRYRGSALKGRPDAIVLRAGLALERADPAALSARIDALRRQRRSTQPNEPSVGSIFKNPGSDFAGRLIEEAGLKGRRLGAALVSPVHANFFVNQGGATAGDMLRLIALARREVARRFGIELDVEIEYIGDQGTEVDDAL